MIKKYSCAFCGNDYDVEYYSNGKPKVIFCSEDCRRKYNEENIKTSKCKYCGKEFRIERYMSGKWDRRQYCCSECEAKDREEHRAETKTIKCLNCGKEIVIQRSKDGKLKSNRRFCSEDCAREYRKSVPVSEGICQVCGKRFKQTYQPKYKKYTQYDCCSDECRKIHSSNGDFKVVTCNNCGKQFKVGRGSDGGFLKRKLCDDCLSHKEEYKTVTCKKCGKEFEVRRRLSGVGFIQRKLCDACLEQHYREHHIISDININFSEQLFRMSIDNELEFNLGHYFYDIFIPEQNTLIEINPSYTHTVVGNHYNDFNYDSRYEDYHVNKTTFAIEHGYRCINVWDWDNKDKILQMLSPKQKMYARKLEVRNISKDKANTFLNDYHLQNSCYGNRINLGLFDKDNTLVQVMTFGKPRYNKNFEWELLRLCSKSDCLVVGGAEKLFKYFINNYKPKSIISYCDASKFKGDVYLRLGMKLRTISAPQKVWSKCSDYITDNLLRQRGFDQLFNTNYGKGTDNEELMLEHNWLPVYDCGQKVYSWFNNDN